MQHYVSGRFKSRAKFLPEKVYIQVRDSIVRGCIETLIMDEKKKKVLLARRGIKPWSKWWTFGSRMVPGESPMDSVVRTVRIDLGLNISPKRLKFLDVVSLLFSTREEPPQENGCHDLSVFYFLQISEREASSINLSRAEYREMRWFNPKDVTLKAGFHPATVECLKKALKS